MRDALGKGRIGLGLLLAVAPALASALSAGPPIAESVDADGQPVLGFCGGARLSATGRHMTFHCNQPELLRDESGTPQSGPAIHVFVRDRLSGQTQLVDVDDEGRYHAQSARYGTVSADGRYVVFESAAPLVPPLDWPAISPGRPYVYLRDTQAGTTELIARMAEGGIPDGAMSQGGRPDFARREILVYGDTDLLTGAFMPFGGSGLFVRNWQTGAVERITVTQDGASSPGGVGVLSADGRSVVFLSSATDITGDNPQGLPNLFIRDRQTQTTRRLSFPAAGGEFQTPVSIDAESLHLTADGRYLLFSSSGHEWVEDGASLPYSNVYWMDVTTGVVTLASTGSRGQRPNDASFGGRISADGRYLAFATRATNLMDTPQRAGVYVKDRLTGAMVDASASLGALAQYSLPDLDLSADGSTLAFTWIDGAYPLGEPRRQQMYSVALRGDPPIAEPIAVSSTTGPAWVVLAILLAGIGTRAARFGDASRRVCMRGGSLRSAALLGLVVMTLAPRIDALEVGPPVLESYGADGQVVIGFCWAKTLSPTTRYLLFSCNYTMRTESGEGPQSDPPTHVYLRDRQTGRVDMLDVDQDGQPHPFPGHGLAASVDGRYVVFHSRAPLTPETSGWVPEFGRAFTYLRDIEARTTELIARTADGGVPEWEVQGVDANLLTSEVVLSSRTDLVGGGTTTWPNLYVRNWRTGSVELITATADGHPSEGYVFQGTLSADGRFVVFVSAATDLTDDNPHGTDNLFLRDRITQRTRRLTFPAAGGEFSAPLYLNSMHLTRDNRYLVFTAYGRELIAGSGDLPPANAYLMDLTDGRVELVSVGSHGQRPNSYTDDVTISADGRYLAFSTRATNLLDTPQPEGGVYVRDRWTGELVNATAGLNGGPEYNSPSGFLSDDGSTLVVTWTDTTLIQGNPDRQRMYSFAIRGGTPASPPEAVPASSDAWRLILLAVLILAGSATLASWRRSRVRA